MSNTQTNERNTRNEAPAAVQARPDLAKPAAPKSANEILARVDEDHNYKHDPINMHSTGGVQKAIERNWQAIQALADHIDGVTRHDDVTDKTGQNYDPATGKTSPATPPGPNGPDDHGKPGVEKQTPANQKRPV